MPAHGNFSKQRARHGNLRNIADTKCGEPRLRLRESLDQIGTPQSDGNDGFPGFVDLFRQRRLLRWHIHISFAIAHTHKERNNCDIVRIRRRELQNAGIHKSRVRAKRGNRIEARPQFALEVFSGIGLWIRIERQHQCPRSLRSIERQEVRRVSQQRHAAVRNVLRFFLPRDAAKFVIQRIYIYEPACIQSEARFRPQDAPNRFIQPFLRDPS